MRGLTLLALFGVCLGQKPARIGPDGKPLLNRPDLAECMKSKSGVVWDQHWWCLFSGKSHMKVGNHNYFLSWREPWHKFEVRWRQADLGLHTTHQAASPTSRILIFLYTASYFQDWDWFNGRNFCRDRCMDLVSFNTPGEFEMFSEIMKRGIQYFTLYISPL